MTLLPFRKARRTASHHADPMGLEAAETPPDPTDRDHMPAIVTDTDLQRSSPITKDLVIRALALVSVILVIALLYAMAVIYELATTAKTDIAMVQWVNDTDHYARIERPARTAEGMETYLAAIAQQYIVLRESVLANDLEMNRRWGPEGEIKLFSDKKIFDAAAGARSYADTRERLRHANRERWVGRFTKLRTGTNQWRFEYETEDRSAINEASDPRDTKRWVVLIQLQNEPRQMSDRERQLNPFGTTVISYSRSELSK